MKDYLKSVVEKAPNPFMARNLAREYVQARILGGLQQTGAMIPMAFHGGTALRFLYQLPRFSEDLDFALKEPDPEFDFAAVADRIRKNFISEAYGVELRTNLKNTVKSCFFRFPGLLFELSLSPHRKEILSIKLELDTNPPKGASYQTSLVRKFIMFQLQHHDRASLFAGKLHALLQRTYTKGRDLYDLLWYLSDPTWPLPNFTLLNHALVQTGFTGPNLGPDNWKPVLKARLESLAWDRVAQDVSPFLEHQPEANMLTQGTFAKLLG